MGVRLSALALSLLLAACSRSQADTSGRTEAGALASAPVPLGGASASAMRGTGTPAAIAITTANRRDALHALNQGRELTRNKKYKAAITQLEAALSAGPNDPIVLAELGYAALMAKDLARGESANAKALANAHEPRLSAMILYNQGQVFEAKKETEKAKAAYTRSLALRDNAAVKQRLARLGGEPQPVASDEADVPCPSSMLDVAAVCKCLLVAPDETLQRPPDAEGSCGEETGAPALGDARLFLVASSAGMFSETVHLLATHEGGRVRLLAELGRDYEPGAMGVHNVATVKGGAKRTEGGRVVVVVRTEQQWNKSTMAGLEVCSDREDRETVCALGGDGAMARCSAPIPVSVTSGCELGLEPGADLSKLDEDTRAAAVEIRGRAARFEAHTTWSLGPDGKLVVKLVPGPSADLVPATVLGEHDFL